MLNSENDEERRKVGIQSVEIGAQILFTLANYSKPATLSELSRELNMAPSNVRRYLVSLANTGLVEQEPNSLRYLLGSACVRLGLLSMGQRPEIEVVNDAARSLRDETDLCVGVLSTNDLPPMMINWFSNGDRITHVGRIGTTFSLVHSASGRTALAYQPNTAIVAAFRKAVREGRKPTSCGELLDEEAFLALTEEIRREGLTHVRGDYTPGIEAYAAPVFNATGEVIFVLTIVGRVGMFEDGHSALQAITALRAAANRVNDRTGYRATTTPITFPETPVLSFRDS